ncbi:MAG: ATP-binding protein [Phycisphaerae bacterium]|jgi:signal transduction histidine kinase
MHLSSPASSPIRQRDGLAAELCHDLDNVLLSLSSHAASLRASLGEPDSSMVRGHLDAIDSALDFLRCRSLRLRRSDGRSPLRPSSVNLRQWWLGVERCLRTSLPERVRLHADLPATLPPVRIAADELTACVMHLLINAGQAIPSWREDGAAKIDATATDGHVVRLRVSDNGAGMTPRSLRMAGSRGFTTRSDGTGLGLHAVRGMIERVGGSIRIRSAQGHGATVELRLPVAPISPGANQ